MKQIGRRIFYNKATGEVLQHTGERSGGVIELLPEEDYLSYNPLTTGIIELQYGELEQEFMDMGSFKVENDTLVIVPKFTYVQDKTEIIADGLDKTTINISHVAIGNDIFTLTVDGQSVSEISNNGIVTFEFSAEVTGHYKIRITSAIYGIANIEVEAV